MHDKFDILDRQNIEYNIHHNKNIEETKEKQNYLFLSISFFLNKPRLHYSLLIKE
jgi:hypothetical protein